MDGRNTSTDGATALGGQKVQLSRKQREKIAHYAICAGGFGENSRLIYGENGMGPHRARFKHRAIFYDENLIRQEFRFSDEIAKQCYYCRFCGRYMGCASCLKAQSLSEIFCTKCGEYSNPVGWWHHGNRAQERHDGLKTIEAFKQTMRNLEIRVRPMTYPWGILWVETEEAFPTFGG